jgi:tubulin--tyrosine ligase-like protein 12
MEIPDELADLSPEEFAFIEFHAPQLIANGIPLTKAFVQNLHSKLKAATFDAGDALQLMEDPGSKCFRLMANKEVKHGETLFLVDHCFSFRYRDLRDALAKNETLRHRLRNMSKFFEERKTLRDQVYRPKKQVDPALNPEFDGDESIVDPRTVAVDWEKVETLSFCYTSIADPDIVADMLTKCPQLKALWLNGCPVSEGPREVLMYKYIEEKHPNLQIYNSKFTKHAKEWAIKLATFGQNCQLSDDIAIEDQRFCDISGRNFYALKDDHSIFDRMQNVRTLKARDTFFDSFGEANRFIEMIRDMKHLERIEMEYYMLDMFWDIKERIRNLNPSIRYINGYDLGYEKPKTLDEEVDYIVENIWKITHSYKLSHGDNVDAEPVYYVLDEVGSALGHDPNPNSLCFPFIYFKNNQPGSDGVTYNILYPLKDIPEGEYITNDFVRGCSPEIKNSRLGIWAQGDAQDYIDKFKAHEKEMEKRFEEGEKVIDEVLLKQKSQMKAPIWDKATPLRVYTDSEIIKTFLKDNRFVLTDSLDDAEALFIIENIKHYKENLGDK